MRNKIIALAAVAAFATMIASPALAGNPGAVQHTIQPVPMVRGGGAVASSNVNRNVNVNVTRNINTNYSYSNPYPYNGGYYGGYGYNNGAAYNSGVAMTAITAGAAVLITAMGIYGNRPAQTQGVVTTTQPQVITVPPGPGQSCYFQQVGGTGPNGETYVQRVCN